MEKWKNYPSSRAKDPPHKVAAGEARRPKTRCENEEKQISPHVDNDWAAALKSAETEAQAVTATATAAEAAAVGQAPIFKLQFQSSFSFGRELTLTRTLSQKK